MSGLERGTWRGRRGLPHCRPSTASKVSLDRVENPPLSLAIAGRRPGVSAAALIARHVGLLHDAEEGASRVLKHNEVVSSTIPPGISPRSQSDQSLNFGLLVRGVEVEMKPTPAAWTPIATLEREIGTFVLWGHGEPPSRLSPARAARNEVPPAKRQPCGRSRGNE